MNKTSRNTNLNQTYTNTYLKDYIQIFNNEDRLNINLNKMNFEKWMVEHTEIWQEKIVVFLKKNRREILIFLHIVGALLIAYIATTIFFYIWIMSDLGSAGTFHLVQKNASSMIIFLSLFVVFLPNPIYALICLILVFFSTAIFLLSINVNFLAMIYLIIYIGAIAILFLFIIMLFNLRELHSQRHDQNPTFKTFFSILGFFFLLIAVKFSSLLFESLFILIEYDPYVYDFANRDSDRLQYFLTYESVDALLFGTLLYEYYSFLFLISGLLLLTSMLGSIVLALSATEKTIELTKNGDLK